MGRRAAAALAIAGVLSAPSALASVVLARTVFQRVGLSAGAVRAITVSCPSRYVAASGGVSMAAPGVALLRARPSGAGAYAFQVGNPAGSSARSVRVSVACVALRARNGAGADLVLKQVGPRSFSVPSGAQRSVALSCPARMLPAGAGVDLAPAGRGRVGGFTGTQLSVRRITTSLRGFSFAVRNSGTTARTVRVFGNCITVVSRPGRPREELRVNVTTFRGWADPGRHVLRRSCRRGWVSLATGYSLPAPSLSLEGAAAVGGSGRWSVRSAGGKATRLVLQLVCARLA